VRDEPPNPTDPVGEPVEIKTDVAQPARVHNYLVGGDDNFAIDRELADYLSSTSPVDIDTARAAARAQGAFMVRTVRYLVIEAGVRQFLSIGATIPTEYDVHEVAQQAAPESRVVYVGHDPVVLAHAHALRKNTRAGATVYIHGSLRRPQKILQEAAGTLDFTKPVAIMLLGILNFVPDEHGPYGIAALLLNAVPSGSYLVLAHATDDTQTELATEVAKRLSEELQRPFVLRSHADISRFFDGLELVEDGLVQIDQWRRHENQPIPLAEELIPIYGGAGRKP
jgi:hypothetical protein